MGDLGEAVMTLLSIIGDGFDIPDVSFFCLRRCRTGCRGPALPLTEWD